MSPANLFKWGLSQTEYPLKNKTNFIDVEFERKWDLQKNAPLKIIYLIDKL